jgi:hypothetical protein
MRTLQHRMGAAPSVCVARVQLRAFVGRKAGIAGLSGLRPTPHVRPISSAASSRIGVRSKFEILADDIRA